jgi:polysaccharide pyruvyl transferase WcaK-like protein
MHRRIVVWPSSLHLLNSGDVAMLQVSVQRMRKLFPRHRICVFVQNPTLLAKYCPEAEPLDPEEVHLARCRSLTPGTILRAMPPNAKRWLHSMERQLLVRSPSSYKALASAKARLTHAHSADLDAAIELLAQTDAVVATGGGFINDSFPSVAERIMKDLLTGVYLSIPVAMFGQGLGPVTKSQVLRIVGELFPELTLLGLRNSQGFGLAVQWMGGASLRIRVTGDDAIGPAYNDRQCAMSGGVGVSIRVTAYSGVSKVQALQFGECMRAAAAIMPAPLVPIVISRHPKDADVECLRALLGDDPLLRSEDQYDSPQKVVSAVKRCRVVVTGSYHAGVFALAQGIPVIGVSSSAYYDGKFLGLRDQFGSGVEVLRLDEPDLGPHLLQCLRRMWDNAPVVREELLAAARKQIALSENAYREFATAVESSWPRALERRAPALPES